MRNGFGLKLLHKFFNLPFLQLQRETLLKQIETNKDETQLTIQELDLYQESDDADYDKFLDNLVNRRRAVADSTSATILVPSIPSSLSNQHISSSNISSSHNNEIKRSLSISGPIGAGNPIPVKNTDLRSPPKKENSLPKMSENMIKTSPQHSQIPTSHSTPKESPKNSENGNNNQERRDSQQFRQQSFMSKIFGNKKEEDSDKLPNISGLHLNSPLTSVEDFVPDDDVLDKSFLEEGNQGTQHSHSERVDSDR